jgi:tetratricopeptide (TPR) repeat protein
MRITLFLLFLIASHYTVSAQCNPEALKRQIKDAAKQMDGKDFLEYLLTLEEEGDQRRDYCVLAVVQERISTYYFNRDADKSIQYRNMAAENYLASKDKLRAVMARQNVAFIYDEQKKDYAKALGITEESIKSWTELNDTLQLANMQKYHGYLLGKTGRYEEAVKQVEKAIANFSAMRNKNGVAVSLYDMASIHFEQKKYIPAALSLQLSKSYWKADSNMARVVGINNFLLRIYLAAGDLENATKAYNDNLQYIDRRDVHWMDKLNFFQYGAEVLKKTAQPKEAENIMAEYKALKDSLIQQGIKPE